VSVRERVKNYAMKKIENVPPSKYVLRGIVAYFGSVLIGAIFMNVVVALKLGFGNELLKTIIQHYVIPLRYGVQATSNNFLATFMSIFPHNLKIATGMMLISILVDADFILAYMGCLSGLILYGVHYQTGASQVLLYLSLMPHGFIEISAVSLIAYSGLYLYSGQFRKFVKTYLIGTGLLFLAGLVESSLIYFGAKLKTVTAKSIKG